MEECKNNKGCSKIMKLKDLDRFDSITIQCHDNPDPDALASAFGLYKYFERTGACHRENFGINVITLIFRHGI